MESTTRNPQFGRVRVRKPDHVDGRIEHKNGLFLLRALFLLDIHFGRRAHPLFDRDRPAPGHPVIIVQPHPEHEKLVSLDGREKPKNVEWGRQKR